jgi:hypothetical protein
MTDSTIRVFVNANGVDVAHGASALDAVRAWDAAAADEVTDGARIITDSRGLPIDGATTMNSGSILRLIANRARNAAAAEEDVEP